MVNPRDDTVSVLRASNSTVLATIPTGDEPRSVALDPNNNFAFVANAAGSSVTVIKIVDATVANFTTVIDWTLKTGAEPWDIDISPDGKRVFVANSGQDTITVINAVTRTRANPAKVEDFCEEDLLQQIDLARFLIGELIPARREAR